MIQMTHLTYAAAAQHASCQQVLELPDLMQIMWSHAMHLAPATEISCAWHSSKSILDCYHELGELGDQKLLQGQVANLKLAQLRKDQGHHL